MTFEEYTKAAMRTLGDRTVDDARIMMRWGLVGETGELVDILKKHVFHDHPVDRTALVKEAGDVLWYIAGIVHVYDVRTVETYQVLPASPVPHDTDASLRGCVEKVMDSAQALQRYDVRTVKTYQVLPASPVPHDTDASLYECVEKVMESAWALQRYVELKAGRRSPMRSTTSISGRFELSSRADDRNVFARMLYSLDFLLAHFDIGLLEVATTNIDKLQQRYPAGFDAARSQHRGVEP